jgi:hypothetical protein
MTPRNLVGKIEVERRVGPRDPEEYRGVAPDAGLAPLEVRELGGAHPFGDRAEADPPGGLGPELGDIGVIRMLGQRSLQRLAGGHPAAALAEPLHRTQDQLREILGVARKRPSHPAFPPSAAPPRGAGCGPMQTNPVLLNSRLQARRSPRHGRYPRSCSKESRRAQRAEARNSSGDRAF